MIRFDPTALYTRADLADALGDTMTADQFLRKFRPISLAKSLYYGQALNDALSRYYDNAQISARKRPKLAKIFHP